jgi:hypothetical protein
MTDEQLKEIAKQIKKKEQEEAAAASAKSKYQKDVSQKNAPPTLAAGNNLGSLPVNRQNPGEPAASVFWAFDQKNLKKSKRNLKNCGEMSSDGLLGSKAQGPVNCDRAG